MSGKRWLTIDPGLGGTGWALWSGRRTHPIDYGTVHPVKSDDLGIRIQSVCLKLWKIHTLGNIEQVFVEMPAFFQSASGTMVARRGDLVKLTLMAGAIIGHFSSLGVPGTLIEVAKWKGQLPKDVVRRRIERRIGKIEGSGTHAADAIGIGLYVNGEF